MIVVELEEGEWADQQGMKLFDIVISIDGEPVNNMFEVRTVIMGNYKPGQTVNLIIIRDGHFRKLKYELSHIDFDGYLKFFDDSTKDKSSGEEGSPMIPEEPKDDEPSAFEEKDEH